MKTETIERLKNIEGLGAVFYLNKKDKQKIKELEDANNHGVFEALKREITIMLTHDSKFKGPEAPIVKKIENNIVFPPVPFSEIDKKNVVSSSPSPKVHKLLIERFRLDLRNEEATLIIGYDG